MKYILVIGDGMADHPLDTLGGRTPLEASKKDAIDALARHGILGSVRNVPEGLRPRRWMPTVCVMQKAMMARPAVTDSVAVGTVNTSPAPGSSPM